MGPEVAALEGNGRAQAAQRRRVYLIDRDYQLREVNRGVLIFMVLIFIQIVLFIGVASLMRAGQLDRVSGPTVFVGIAFVVPMLMCVLYSWVTVRQTHRVAGAAFRLGQDIRRIVADPSFRFRLREGDYLQEIALELNRVMERIEARQAGLKRAADAAADLEAALQDLCADLAPEEVERVRACLGTLAQALTASRSGIVEEA